MKRTLLLMVISCAIGFGSLHAEERLERGCVVYTNPNHNAEPVAFTIPLAFTADDVVQATYQGGWGSESADGLWRMDGSRIHFNPVKQWRMGMTLVELKLADGGVVDFFVIIYSGKFSLGEKAPEYHHRVKQAGRFARLISAGYTDYAESAAVIEKDAFSGERLARVEINGEHVGGARLTGQTLICSPSPAWRTGLNRIEIYLEGEEEPHLHLLSHHPHVIPVEYSMESCSIGGKSFFPRAVYYVKPASFPKVASFGFNMVHDYSLRSLPEKEVSAYLQEADAHGLKVFSHINKSALEEGDVIAFAERIARQMAEPALFAWYFWDEPSPNDMPAKYYVFFADLVRRLDPHHPLISSHWYQSYYRGAGEMDMRQLYHGKTAEMAKGLTFYKRIMASTGSPWVAIVNAHEGYKPKECISISPRGNMGIIDKATSPEQRNQLEEWLAARSRVLLSDLANPPFPVPPTLPQTREQIRGQAFEAIVQGSNGIFYWPYREPDDLDPVLGWYTLFHLPEPSGYMRELMHDLKTLEPLISNPGKDSVSWVEDGVRFWQRSVEGNTIVIAVNENKGACSITTRIKPLSNQNWPERLVRFGHADESTIQLKNGSLSDYWKPDQAHVYLLHPLPDQPDF
jgi:hypothetical protein